MNRFFNYHNALCSGLNTYNAFAYDPYIIAIKELLVSELQKIAYYIEKLVDINKDMSEYTDKVIDFISVLIINLDFKKESFFIIFDDLYKNRKTIEEMYVSEYSVLNMDYKLLDDWEIELNSKEEIIKLLNIRKRDIEKKALSSNRRNLYEIILILVLNSCNCLIDLKNLKVDFPKAKRMVLKLLNCFNLPLKSDVEIKKIILDFSKFSYQTMKLLYEKNIEHFGPLSKTKVLLSVKKGKSVLVSASSYLELEKLLIALTGLDINVYTHNDMISAFQYEKLRQYPNLTGNYKNEGNNLFADFASFPGPIYVSKNSILKTDVIRGQIYTSSKYPPYGIGKIENGDFAPLIRYAENSNGFEKSEHEKFLEIGFDGSQIDEILHEILTKYKNNEINRIFIIGLMNGFNQDNEYIKTLINKSDTKDYIISFSYNSDRLNFAYINPYFDFHAVYRIIETLFANLEEADKKLAVFMADCSSVTLTHIFNLIYLGVKHIFLGACCPNIINPGLLKGLYDNFGIKELSEPISDIDKIV